MAWQVQEAKQRFSEFLRKAEKDGPQVVTRRGEEVAVLVSIETFRRLDRKEGLVAFLLSAPDLTDLEFDGRVGSHRTVDLE